MLSIRYVLNQKSNKNHNKRLSQNAHTHLTWSNPSARILKLPDGILPHGIICLEQYFIGYYKEKSRI
jgi:hypothetical protein